MIRMQRLKELCSKVCNQQRHHTDEDNDDTMIALDYLRNQVAPVVNHENEAESNEFHQICANLCLLETLNDDDAEQGDGRDSFIFDLAKSEGLGKDLCLFVGMVSLNILFVTRYSVCGKNQAI